MERGKSLLIISENVEGGTSATLIVNELRGDLEVATVEKILEVARTAEPKLRALIEGAVRDAAADVI